jgi:preprotein translocase SecE subunit
LSNDRKWIYLSYLIATALVAWVLHKLGAMVLGIVGLPNPRLLEVAPATAVGGCLIAGVAALIYFSRDKVQTFSLEVLQELKKVTWPLRKTAYLSTVVVLVLVMICAVFLGLFDALSNWFVKIVLSA